MKPIPARWMVVAAVVALAVSVGAPGLTPREAAAAQQPVKGDVVNGKALYEKKCAVCHGPEGKGDGEAEFVLFPKPRNFTTGVFKIRSTTTLPTDDDLFGTITHGISGTAMPSWASLNEAERRDVVAFIKGFASRFTEEQAGPPIVVPTPPSRSQKLLDLGKHEYTEAGCFKCHGKGGKGDGPSAKKLKDDWDYPIIPYDFTIAGRMKRGSTIRDIYMTLTAGIGGTPMPSYAESLSEEERWGLAYYTLSLAGKSAPAPIAQEVTTIRSHVVTGSVPADPSAALWRKAKPVVIRTRTLWLRPNEAGPVRVASYHNGQEIGILLEWDDPVGNHEMLRAQDFRDAAAVQFPMLAGEPHYAMGEHNGPVNTWHWKADWEADLARYRDMQDSYPNMAYDLYQFLKESPQPGGALVRVATASHDPTYLTGWGAGNLFSRPSRLTPVENLNATGLGTLTSQPSEYQTVKGHGIWADGKWRVVMVRALRTDNERDTQFKVGATIPVAFAVWDGGQGDRNGQKAVTVWQQLTLDPKR
ncbi:MAG: c-type cytochrome [candidate division NC10 bacterium]|nr:c-type cytochrome [candidate division NC10 bacterium]